jgi:predicted O-linked N-acetylglucosamine transferase (SPINDLY family)
VDLSGHTGGCRLPLFTRRPAPIQVTAWGFAHGTGCPEIDYFFADPIAVPEDERRHYAEKVIDLPCIVTFDPPEEYQLNGVSKPPYQYNNGVITFGCFSRFEKLSTAYLATAQEILLEVPNSRLILKDNAYRRPYSIERVREIMDAVDPKRILFSYGTNQPDHFLAYQQADLILDPFPHSGGTCCLEQLWMGVPIVTLYGKQAAGRTTSSVLSNMGLDGWVTMTRDNYIASAVGLARKPDLLDPFRKTLRKKLLDSPVVKGYVKAVEEVYENIVKEKAGAPYYQGVPGTWQ